jgi:protein DGCR14
MTDKMPEKSLTITKDKSLFVFKEPALPKKRVKVRKHKVLDEDIYLQQMGKIIERDFFPDLEKLKAQNEYLDALDKNDLSKLREIHAKYTSGSRMPTSRYSSPATFDTPIDTRPSDDNSLREEEGQNKTLEPSEITSKNKLTLDEYLANHTSEDNESFEEIIKESELRHEQKHAWLYKKETTNVEALPGKLNVPSIEQQAGQLRPLELDTWGYKNHNYIMFVPDGVELTPEEKVEMAKRKQEIVHLNTRLVANPFDENQSKEQIQGLAQSQAKNLDGKIGVDGKELVTETPKINGYGFVKTPSPAPGVNESPLMTWGEIEGTPFRLDGGDTPLRTTPGPSFWIPEPPKRERLALKLADKVNEQHRDRKKKAIEAAKKQLTSPRPGSGVSMDRLHSMSPAARKFASTHLRKNMGSDKALMASYSPARQSPHGTPKIDTHHRTPTPHNLITTDNLLNISLPKRPRASDFFD